MWVDVTSTVYISRCEQVMKFNKFIVESKNFPNFCNVTIPKFDVGL
jgi:hypothetical protein